jgi:uncharacterized protein DUF1707
MDDRRTARDSDNPRSPDTVRAADKDRELVVEHLKTALQDGRLKMDEYMERMDRAYQAVTYGDLARLQDDLPATVGAPAGKAAVTVGTPTVPVRRAARGFAGLPTALRVLWAIYLVPVIVNVVVWTLVCVTSGHLVYPWPVWVAGPLGAVLLGVTLIVQAARSGRRR